MEKPDWKCDKNNLIQEEDSEELKNLLNDPLLRKEYRRKPHNPYALDLEDLIDPEVLKNRILQMTNFLSKAITDLASYLQDEQISRSVDSHLIMQKRYRRSNLLEQMALVMKDWMAHCRLAIDRMIIECYPRLGNTPTEQIRENSGRDSRIESLKNLEKESHKRKNGFVSHYMLLQQRSPNALDLENLEDWKKVIERITELLSFMKKRLANNQNKERILMEDPMFTDSRINISLIECRNEKAQLQEEIDLLEKDLAFAYQQASKLDIPTRSPNPRVNTSSAIHKRNTFDSNFELESENTMFQNQLQLGNSSFSGNEKREYDESHQQKMMDQIKKSNPKMNSVEYEAVKLLHSNPDSKPDVSYYQPRGFTSSAQLPRNEIIDSERIERESLESIIVKFQNELLLAKRNSSGIEEKEIDSLLEELTHRKIILRQKAMRRCLKETENVKITLESDFEKNYAGRRLRDESIVQQHDSTSFSSLSQYRKERTPPRTEDEAFAGLDNSYKSSEELNTMMENRRAATSSLSLERRCQEGSSRRYTVPREYSNLMTSSSSSRTSRKETLYQTDDKRRHS